MSDWVNWGDYEAIQRPEVQRQADVAEAARSSQQVQMDASLHNLSSEANRRAREGNFQGVQSLGGYGAVMDARDKAQRQQAASGMAAGALAKPAWEQDLTQGHSGTYVSPWANLDARLSAGSNKAAQQSNSVNQQRAAAQQAAERKRIDDEARAKNEAAMHGKRDDEAAQYAEWSDAVNRSASNTGGIGAGAYYDAASGRGPKPVSVYSTPRTKKTQQMGYATPTNSNSNFGLNSGYSSGNDWNF